MRFRVENLGPLHKAEVDLSKDLLVLAGPNNSGKTYLAWTLYGLHRARQSLKDVLAPWVTKLFQSPDHAFQIADLLAAVDLGSEYAAAFVPQVHQCFSTSNAQFSAARLSLLNADVGHGERLAISEAGGMLVNLHFHEGRVSFGVVSSGREVNAFLPEEWIPNTDAFLASLRAGSRPRLEARIARNLSEIFCERILGPCKIFPVERIAIDVFAKELALNRSDLVDQIVDVVDSAPDGGVDLLLRRVGRYPWPIRDCLHTANDASYLSWRKGDYAPLADELESLVLGGSMGVSDAGEIQFSPKSAPTELLPIHLASSVVKSLASLVFYFRHQARANEFLIIDEPELNLHPDNQRQIARFLVKAVNRGFKVMISTHSDIILRELNQLIMLAKLEPDQRRDLGRDAETALPPTRVGVYLFDNGSATSVPVEETGFSIKTIDDVLSQLNADDQKLYARLFDEPTSTE